MTNWLVFFGIIYLIFIILIYIKYFNNIQASSYFFGDGNIGPFLTFVGISATLFSAFTLKGMPEFFAKHGIGAWVFLLITDICLAIFILILAVPIRKKVRKIGAFSITQYLHFKNSPKYVRIFYCLFSTIFLIPYITIQIKGAAYFLNYGLPIDDNGLCWSMIIVCLMLFYTYTGGIKAVYDTDAIQGAIMLTVVWVIAAILVIQFGSLSNLFIEVEKYNAGLLNTPGPLGLLDTQFLIISFISICCMPYVQPHLATRLFISKNTQTLAISTLGLGLFAFLIIAPTMIIGLGAVSIYGGDQNILILLLNDMPHWLFALFIIGLTSAAMSTSDSQLLALGTEWLFVNPKTKNNNEKKTLILNTFHSKVTALIVAIICLLLSLSDFKEIVLFSVNSFIGTSLFIPLVVGWIFFKRNTAIFLSFISLIFSVLYLLSLFGIIINNIGGLRIEILLYIVAGISILISYFYEKI